jgi:hypothetical protein
MTEAFCIAAAVLVLSMVLALVVLASRVRDLQHDVADLKTETMDGLRRVRRLPKREETVRH